MVGNKLGKVIAEHTLRPQIRRFTSSNDSSIVPNQIKRYANPRQMKNSKHKCEFLKMNRGLRFLFEIDANFRRAIFASEAPMESLIMYRSDCMKRVESTVFYGIQFDQVNC